MQISHRSNSSVMPTMVAIANNNMDPLKKRPAEKARISAGLSLTQAANLARVCPKYLLAVERRGGASYRLATRLAKIYGVSANLFLYGPKGIETPCKP
ncbi:MAG: hypothetical protein ABJA67_17830 [Chthonomonadales bacterium]